MFVTENASGPERDMVFPTGYTVTDEAKLQSSSLTGSFSLTDTIFNQDYAENPAGNSLEVPAETPCTTLALTVPVEYLVSRM